MEKGSHRRADFRGVGFQREVTGVEKANLRIGEIAAVRLCPLRPRMPRPARKSPFFGSFSARKDTPIALRGNLALHRQRSRNGWALVRIPSVRVAEPVRVLLVQKVHREAALRE